MSTMPKTDEEWREYEADKIMHKALLSRADLNKTHSPKQVMDRWLEVERSSLSANKETIHD